MKYSLQNNILGIRDNKSSSLSFRNTTNDQREKKLTYFVLFTIKQINFANKLNKEYNLIRPFANLNPWHVVHTTNWFRKFPYKGQLNILQLFFKL